MVPPHLPAPSCNIEVHKKWQHIKLFLLAAILGLIGGGSGASVILGWIWPAFDSKDQWTISYFQSTSPQIQLEQRVREEVKDRIVSVYNDASQTAGTAYLGSDHKVGDGVMVSSDGWLAVYSLPDSKGYKSWKVLTDQGKVFSVEQGVADPYTGVLFLKIVRPETASLYKQIEFSEKISAGDDIFVYQDKLWQHSSVAHPVYISPQKQAAHLDGVSIIHYAFTYPFSSGTLVVNNQGRMVGFVAKDGTLLPSNQIQTLLPTVLTKQVVMYRSLGAEGWFDEEQPLILDKGRTAGFVVEKIINKRTLLKPGDIILEIRNEIVDPESLWYTIKYNQEAELKVLRQKKIITLTTPILEIQP